MSSASSDLFAVQPHAPLAELLRPRTLDEVIGQTHLVGPGKPLRLAFESGTPHSMILWGPPGVGKTTLARLMADSFEAEFIALSAVFSGVKDIREAMQQAELTLAQSDRRTILFVDEVHRFNKAQQDAFLPYVEQGIVTLVGATTENPSFEVNSALLSRASVYVLKSLSEDELAQLFERARAKAFPDIGFNDEARERLIGYADGDARRLLNVLEQIRTAATTAGVGAVDNAFLEAALAADLRRFDKGGDAFYDQISALHKSVRGSDPDAALYWLVRMLDGGADPLYMGRRMIRMAVEDIGLADPRAPPAPTSPRRQHPPSTPPPPRRRPARRSAGHRPAAPRRSGELRRRTRSRGDPTAPTSLPPAAPPRGCPLRRSIPPRAR
jgi:putative ATPase